MFSRAIYYPYILIPDNLWLRRVILYWDRICPIVPWTLQEDIPPNHVSRELEAAGVLEFIQPEQYLGWREGVSLSEEFSDIVSSKRFQKALGPKKRRSYSSRIHSDKFTGGLLSDIKSLDLYVQSKNSGGWLLFEEKTASLYMGLLASSLAKQLSMDPLTDNPKYHSGFLKSQFLPSDRKEAFISLILQDILPTPRDPIDVRVILEFKNKYEQELLTFRRSIRNMVDSLYSSDKPVSIDGIVNALKDEMKENCLLLQRRLSENKIETTFAVLESVFPLELPKIATILGASYISIPLGLGLLGTNASIKISKAIFEGSKRRNSILESNPYSYIFRIQKQLL